MFTNDCYDSRHKLGVLNSLLTLYRKLSVPFRVVVSLLTITFRIFVIFDKWIWLDTKVFVTSVSEFDWNPEVSSEGPICWFNRTSYLRLFGLFLPILTENSVSISIFDFVPSYFNVVRTPLDFDTFVSDFDSVSPDSFYRPFQPSPISVPFTIYDSILRTRSKVFVTPTWLLRID